jgi:pyruvate dehydrogenase E1 component beta subunit
MQRLSYADAIREAFRQKMAEDSRVFVVGQGVTNPWYVGTTMTNLDKQFGSERVIDPPVSEQGINGVVIGAALAGMRPVVVHPRLDFLLMGVEQIVNQAANWCYMFAGRASVPLVVRGIINRGGEQAAQHSQALQATFMHIPGLKVVMPATPYDAKGLLIASIEDDNPVIYIDDRWLYDEVGDVPEEMYTVPIGKGAIRREGADVTVVAISYMVLEAVKAASALEEQGVDVELIDVRSLKPLDEDMIFQSVRKTGRLVIAEAAWKTGGAAGEISALVAENVFEHLKAPVVRVALPDVPAPASSTLEGAFYVRSGDIVSAVLKVLKSKSVAPLGSFGDDRQVV